MDTIIEEIKDIKKSKKTFLKAKDILNKGGLVAFPTETVYGLGGDALNKNASHKIYKAKGRPSDNPLIVHIANEKDVYKLATNINESAKKLMEAFWPGPLTIVFNKSEIVPRETTGGLDTVAIRMPASSVALELIKISNTYIAAPSANISGRPSPIYASHVIEDLSGKIDMIIARDSKNIGIESTIVDVTGKIPVILRPGYITYNMLKDIVGEVEIDKSMLSNVEKTLPKAPGMKYTHYAPKGELSIVKGKEVIISDLVIEKINQLARKKQKEGYIVGVIATEKTCDKYKADYVINMGNRDYIDISITLYDILRQFDSLGVEYIYSEAFDEKDVGYAIMNRLIKAAGHRIIII